jgi:methyltransferase
MELTSSLVWFWTLLVAVGILRLSEMRVSKRRQRALAVKGIPRVKEPHFLAMVILHTSILVGAGVEATVWNRPAIPIVTVVALVAVAAANALRIWVIATMGPHWNVQIMNSLPLGVVTEGPFRFVRHPNYVAVFVELAALPLVHGAWVTAALGSAAHIWVLSQRIRAEEAVLLAHPTYRQAMAEVPRFFPRWRRRGVVTP